MLDDSKAILDDILAAWHRWAKGYQHVGGINSSPMFRNAKTSKGWDSLDDLADSEIDGGRNEAVEFHVMSLEPTYRTALQLLARNIVTGLSVWTSPRLPQDPEERAVVVMEARNALMRRLMTAGVV